MKIALDSEKRAMQRIWKEREKQIEIVVTNTICMYGSIKGIAGNAIQSVKLWSCRGMMTLTGLNWNNSFSGFCICFGSFS